MNNQKIVCSVILLIVYSIIKMIKTNKITKMMINQKIVLCLEIFKTVYLIHKMINKTKKIMMIKSKNKQIKEVYLQTIMIMKYLNLEVWIKKIIPIVNLIMW